MYEDNDSPSSPTAEINNVNYIEAVSKVFISQNQLERQQTPLNNIKKLVIKDSCLHLRDIYLRRQLISLVYNHLPFLHYVVAN